MVDPCCICLDKTEVVSNSLLFLVSRSHKRPPAYSLEGEVIWSHILLKALGAAVNGCWPDAWSLLWRKILVYSVYNNLKEAKGTAGSGLSPGVLTNGLGSMLLFCISYYSCIIKDHELQVSNKM